MKKSDEKFASKKRLEKLYVYKEQHPIIAIVVTALLGFISFVVGICGCVFFGTNLACYIVSLVIFSILTGVSVLFQYSDHRYDDVYVQEREAEKEKLKQDLDFQIRLSNNVQDVCEAKLTTLRNFVADMKVGNKEVPQIIDNPDNQLRTLTTAINKTFAKLLGKDDNNIRNNDIYVHILYRFCNDADESWFYTGSSSEYEYDDLNSLFKGKSQFSECLKQNHHIYLVNSKQIECERGYYIRCPHDEEKDGKLCGSVVFYKIPITSAHEYKIMDAIIMVYTCKQKFTQSDDKDSLKTVSFNIDTIITEFKSRIQIELILLYVQHLYEQGLQNGQDIKK